MGEAYIRPLREKYTRYTNVTTPTMLTNLYTGYTRIIQIDLEEKNKLRKKEWYLNHPIEALFEHIEDAIDYAADWSTPYQTEQIISASYNLLFKTGIFNDN